MVQAIFDFESLSSPHPPGGFLVAVVAPEIDFGENNAPCKHIEEIIRERHWTHIAQQGYEAAHYIGPSDRDQAFFERAAARPVDLQAANAIVCTGLNDDERETAESYRPLLEQGLKRGLPFVCANPDLVVDVGGRLYICAGALADIYQHMGGDVYWAGKPYPAAYETAAAAAAKARDRETDPKRVLVIGDALRTDIAGAFGQGLDSLFIGAGIHRHEVMGENGRALDPEKLALLFAGDAPRATAAMPILAW